MTVLRDLHRGELTLKDMSVMRERGETAKEQSKRNNAFLTDYSLNHVVSMQWGPDFAESRRDLRPFKLRVDGRPFVLSWGELKDADSAGFFRREAPNPSRYTLRFFDGPKLTLSTQLNDEATRDMIVCLKGPNFEIFLDWYEVLRYGRWI